MLFVKRSRMAGLCWMSVTAMLLAIAGNGLTAVDQNQLARIVQEILERYKPTYTDGKGQRREPMFSVAVSVPYNSATQMYDMSKVTDASEEVRETILKCYVYTGTRVVAATVLKWPNVLDQCPNERVQCHRVLNLCPDGVLTWAGVQPWYSDMVIKKAADHAEYRTLQHFSTLLNNRNKDDLLIFYIRASPCDQKCTKQTHPQNILHSINQILNWNNYAVVFSDVFKPREGQPIPENNLRDSLKRLGAYSGPCGTIGLKNIFRCNQQGKAMQCTSCSDREAVARYCFSDDFQPVRKQGRGHKRGQKGGRRQGWQKVRQLK